MKSHSNYYNVELKASAENTGNTLAAFFFPPSVQILLLKLSSVGIHQCPFPISLKRPPKRIQRQVIFSSLSFCGIQFRVHCIFKRPRDPHRERQVELKYTRQDAFIILKYSLGRIIGVIISLFRREATQALLNISKGLKNHCLQLTWNFHKRCCKCL